MTTTRGATRPAIPAELYALMEEIGPRWAENIPEHVRLMIEGFTEVLDQAPRPDLKVMRDIAYGPHERQAIDVYAPRDAAAPLPALLFVHGGGFVDGHRNRNARIYANVLEYFASHDVVGINVGHRLAGDAGFPGGSQDVAAVVAWVRQNADEIGVDADRIFLMGHSAGAAHTGSYAYDKRLQPPGGPGLRGHIVVSGRVRADNWPDNPNARKVEAYYGTADMAVLDTLSQIAHVGADSVPTFIAWAEYENPLLDVFALDLAYRLGIAKRRAPPTLWLKGHNHISVIAHFGTAEDALGKSILEFIANPK